jgi:hypothetical protein
VHAVEERRTAIQETCSRRGRELRVGDLGTVWRARFARLTRCCRDGIRDLPRERLDVLFASRDPQRRQDMRHERGGVRLLHANDQVCALRGSADVCRGVGTRHEVHAPHGSEAHFVRALRASRRVHGPELGAHSLPADGRERAGAPNVQADNELNRCDRHTHRDEKPLALLRACTMTHGAGVREGEETH